MLGLKAQPLLEYPLRDNDMARMLTRSAKSLPLALAMSAIATVTAGRAEATANGAFLSHQALYELSLLKSRGSNSINSARGRILYSFTGSACEGYTSEFRQVSEMDSGEDKVTLSDLRSTSWEDAAGKTYRFKIDSRMNDVDTSPVDGIAERVGDHITVKLKQPQTKTFTLDGSTVFPTQLIQDIITAAKQGKPILERSVYDGTDDGEKVFNTLAVIGQAIRGDQTIASPDPSTENDVMKSATRWPVTVSYFERDAKPEDGEQTPLYAMSFELFENGVSRALVLDYNDFVISGSLGKFNVKDSKPCK
jgi:hypothetical protein